MIQPADKVLGRFDWRVILSDLNGLEKNGHWNDPDWAKALRAECKLEEHNIVAVILCGYRHAALKAKLSYDLLKTMCGEVYPEGVLESSIDDAVAERISNHL